MTTVMICEKCKNEHTAPLYGYIPNSNISICPFCKTVMKKTNMMIDDYFVITDTSKDINFLESMIKLHDEDIIEYESRMSQFRANDQWYQEQHNPKPEPKEDPNVPKCPKCGCKNIQVVRKKWSFFRGFATNATERVCVNCNYKW